MSRVVGIAWAMTMLLASVAAAQTSGAELTGRVLDPAGAGLPAATITVTATRTGEVRVATSQDSGQYSVGALRPGEYTIEVRLAGFRRYHRDGIRLPTGERIRLDVPLTIGGPQESVTVAADTPVLQVESGRLSQVIPRRAVAALPLNGRSFIALVTLVPGVANPPGSAFPRINGGRPRVNEYLFDGISVLQPEPGQVAFMPVADAIDELQVITNSAPAEFGRFNGGIVNLTTRSGTNRLTGAIFEFGRHEALNARNAFAPSGDKPRFRRHQAGGVLGGPLVRNRTFFFADYQATRQDVDRVRISTVPTLLQRQGVFTEAVGGRVPAIFDPATTRVGGDGTFVRDPFPANTIPAGRLDPVARALLERFPLPSTAGTANNYRRVGLESLDQDQGDLRLDHTIGAADRLFARLSYLRDLALPVTPLPDGSGNITTGAIGRTDTRALALASAWTRTLGRRLLNDLRVGYTRRRVGRTGLGLGAPASQALGLPGLPANAAFNEALPTFLIDGVQQLGSPVNTNSNFRTDVTQLVDVLSWQRGAHLIKVGADIRHERLDVTQPPSPTGSFRFSTLFTDLPGRANTGSSLASFLLGQVQTFSIDLQSHVLRPRAWVQEYFAQDDWRVASQLTVNAGLRYTLNLPSTEVDDQGAVFNLATERLDYLGVDGAARSSRDLRTKNLGPRLGLAWSMSDRTVLRAGYGLVWVELAGITTPFINPQFPFLQTVTQRTLDSVQPAFALAAGPSVAPLPPGPDAGLGQGVFTVDRDLGGGYVQQWNLAVQRELRPSLSLEVAYAGSKISHIGLPDTNINQLSVDQLALGRTLLDQVPNPFSGQIPVSSSIGGPTVPRAQLLKPFPRFTTVSYYRNNVGDSIYHGVQLKLERRASRGLSWLVSYARSKLLDDASSVFDATILTGPVTNAPVADSFNRRLERDLSGGDIPNVFVASAVWQLPAGRDRRWQPRGWLGLLAGGWDVAGVLTLQSGVPLAVTQATNFNAFAGFGIQRPNRVGDPTLPASARTTAAWFDVAAFETAPQFTLGTSSRNPVRGPGYRNLDLAVMRHLPLGRRVSLELRAEAFNLTNTPPLGAPNTVLGTPGFGSITSAGDPRVLQLAARLSF